MFTSVVRVLQGRLTMADGLWFAQEHGKVEAVIDIATLVRPVVWVPCAQSRHMSATTVVGGCLP